MSDKKNPLSLKEHFMLASVVGVAGGIVASFINPSWMSFGVAGVLSGLLYPVVKYATEEITYAGDQPSFRKEAGLPKTSFIRNAYSDTASTTAILLGAGLMQMILNGDRGGSYIAATGLSLAALSYGLRRWDMREAAKLQNSNKNNGPDIGQP